MECSAWTGSDADLLSVSHIERECRAVAGLPNGLVDDKVKRAIGLSSGLKRMESELDLAPPAAEVAEADLASHEDVCLQKCVFVAG